MYNIGFVLSFISTFIILLANNYLKKINNIKSILFITLLINLFTFPIIVNMNNEFNNLLDIIEFGESYGVTGDGVTDDSIAINDLLATGKNITFRYRL